jgi:hypothetical protein
MEPSGFWILDIGYWIALHLHCIRYALAYLSDAISDLQRHASFRLCRASLRLPPPRLRAASPVPDAI